MKYGHHRQQMSFNEAESANIRCNYSNCLHSFHFKRWKAHLFGLLLTSSHNDPSQIMRREGRGFPKQSSHGEKNQSEPKNCQQLKVRCMQ